MSSIAALTSPDQNTKPGLVLYTEGIVSKTNTTNDIDSKTNLTIGGTNATAVTIGHAGIQTNVVGNAFSSNGLFVPVWRASLLSTGVIFDSTTTETSIIGPIVGSMTVQPINASFMLISEHMANINLSGTTSLNIRYKINNVIALSVTIPAGLVVNQAISIRHVLNVKLNGDIDLNCIIQRDGSAVIVRSTPGSLSGRWTLGAANTISMTGQFNDNSGQFGGFTFGMWSSQTS